MMAPLCKEPVFLFIAILCKIIIRYSLNKETIQLRHCKGMFLDNTNLYWCPISGIGLLVAYTKDSKKMEDCSWNLGVTAYLHPQHTVIYKLLFKKNKLVPTEDFDSFNYYDKRYTLKIRYLNHICDEKRPKMANLIKGEKTPILAL